MDAMTSSYRNTIENDSNIAKWGVKALVAISRNGGLPDMVIGRPGAPESAFEDGGHTLILPLPADSEKCYAALNETGGVTLMLAEDY